MKNLQLELKEKIEELHNLQRVEKHLLQLNKRVQTERNKLQQVVDRLNQENEDIEKLEKLSIKSIFHKVLGDKEKQLEKERQEYLQTSLKYDEHRKTLELLEYEQEVLQKKINKSVGLETEIEKLIELRKNELLRNDPSLGHKLIEITQNMEHHQKMIVDMEEAIQAGERASGVLNQMIQVLKQARNWGNWDMMGDKRMASYLKHSKLDTARQLSYQAKQLLMQFEDELKDVYEYERRQFDFSLNFDSFSSFTDIFVDNLISDWIIQQKISNALSSVVATRDKVIRTISYLQSDIPKQESEIVSLEELKTEIIVKG